MSLNTFLLIPTSHECPKMVSSGKMISLWKKTKYSFVGILALKSHVLFKVSIKAAQSYRNQPHFRVLLWVLWYPSPLSPWEHVACAKNLEASVGAPSSRPFRLPPWWVHVDAHRDSQITKHFFIWAARKKCCNYSRYGGFKLQQKVNKQFLTQPVGAVHAKGMRVHFVRVHLHSFPFFEGRSTVSSCHIKIWLS